MEFQEPYKQPGPYSPPPLRFELLYHPSIVITPSKGKRVIWDIQLQTITFEMYVDRLNPYLDLNEDRPTFSFNNESVIVEPENPDFLFELVYLIQKSTIWSGMGVPFFECELKIKGKTYGKLGSPN